MFPSLELIISMVRGTLIVKFIALPSRASSISGAGYEKKTNNFLQIFFSIPIRGWKKTKCMVLMSIKLSTVHKLWNSWIMGQGFWLKGKANGHIV